MLQLSNERLRVDIASPGTFYRGPRFDWSGFVMQVTLDGVHTFCAPESLETGVGSGGHGLCNEFGIFQPISYDCARPGEAFTKLGVGLLQRLNEHPYDFTQPYPLKPFPLAVQQQDDAIVFQFEPVPCRGYAARLKKTARLQGERLRFEYELENVGSELIATHEYGHNFLAIDQTDPGPDYVLTLSSGLELRHKPEMLKQEGKEIQWTTPLIKPTMCGTMNNLNLRSEEPIWQLLHKPTGVRISETLDYPVARVALWCAPHVLSPEAFINLEVQPGERLKWTREYRFSSKDS